MALELISFGTGANWINQLWKKLSSGKKKYYDELEEINLIMFGDPLELAEYYVEPECQERNPADRHEEDFLVAREPMMKKIDQFFSRKIHIPGDNQMFILSDAGMGKTALLTMLKLMHMTSFWPQKLDCVLKKLGEGIIEELKQIKNKRETILLLDSLDEDPTAYGRVHERLFDILRATQYFHRVIVTCRTQFFPEIKEDPLERLGLISIGGFTCPVKYLSFFTDAKVTEYLTNRFPKKYGILTDKKKIEEAQKVIEKMGSLRCRPMLLAYIEDLMDSPLLQKDDSEYKIYEALVESWLNREKTKADISRKGILHACIILAAIMQIREKRSISERELDNLISKISGVRPVKHIQLKGRSLLNRNSEGDYRFSHYSIQEFLVSKLLLEEPVMKPKYRIPVTDFIFRMIKEKAPNFPDLFDFRMLNINIDDLKNISSVFKWEYLMKNSLDMEFVYIPPGKFMMGSPANESGRLNNETQHRVTLTKGFYMQTTQVTQRQWRAVMGENPSFFQKGDDYPVENVSWNDVQEFINKLNQKGEGVYRLPTEAEWEYSCRAGTDTAYYFGDDTGHLDEYAWYNNNSDRRTHPVGQKKPNGWRLYDMHGNVWEWCQDWYGDYPSFAVINPAGPETGSLRVHRGGSWVGDAEDCRSACRDYYSPDLRYLNLGFRLSRGLHL